MSTPSSASSTVANTLALTTQAGTTTLGTVFRNRVQIDKNAIAVIEGEQRLTFVALNERVNRLVHVLAGLGIQRGDRVAIFSRNCTAYVELELAAAKLGAIVAAINWRLADAELIHCITLAEPQLILVAADYVDTLERLNLDIPLTIELGDDYNRRLAKADASEPPDQAQSEDCLIIIYTSGTTGL